MSSLSLTDLRLEKKSIKFRARKRRTARKRDRTYAEINGSAEHRPSQAWSRTHVTVVPTSDLERAVVKWFKHDKGYGFLTRGKGTKDIFVHKYTLRQCGFGDLFEGQVVLVRYGRGPKGLMAAEIRPGRA